MLRVHRHLQPSPESILTGLRLWTVAVVAVGVGAAIAVVAVAIIAIAIVAIVAIVVWRLAVSGSVSMVQYDSEGIRDLSLDAQINLDQEKINQTIQ